MCIYLDLSQTGLCWVYVWWSGFGSGKRLDWSQLWVSVLLSLVSQVQTASFLCLCQMQHRSDPVSARFHTHLLPPSGIFLVTPGFTWVTHIFCLTSCRPSYFVFLLQDLISFKLRGAVDTLKQNRVKICFHTENTRSLVTITSPHLPILPGTETENTLSCYGQQESLHERVVFTRSNRCGQWEDWGHSRSSLT